MSLCLGIFIDAIKRLFETHELKDIDLLLYVGIIGLTINLIGLFIFGHGHSHDMFNNADDIELISNKLVTQNDELVRKDIKKKTKCCSILCNFIEIEFEIM